MSRLKLTVAYRKTPAQVGKTDAKPAEEDDYTANVFIARWDRE